ncbi:MAG: GGDEF domain-containing protein [Candidatus Omnitrophota bacterium]
MLGLIIALVSFSLLLCAFLKRRLDRRIINMPVFNQIKGQHDKFLAENDRLKKNNRDLQGTLEGIIALYDITEQICKTLDIDAVFDNFRNEMHKYIRIGDCEFLKGRVDLSPYKDKGYTIIPLNIQDELVGYLMADGIKEEDRERFHILSQQFLLGIKRAILYQGVQELSIIDTLTNSFNRRHYLERFNEEMERSKKFSYKFCCLMIDIDYFKSFNDRYGHIVGDAILRELSRTIQGNIRQIDLMCRYGGEEFSIILSETEKAAARFAAERIRSAVQDKHIRVYDEELKITVSIGISAYPDDGKDITKLIDAADSALYRAKQAGRNMVFAYGAR